MFGLDVAVHIWPMVGVLVASGSAVQADPVTHDGWTFSDTVDIVYNDIGQSVTAGQHRLHFTGEEHLSFSVDLDALVLESWNAGIQSVDVIHAGRPIAWLHDTFAPNIASDLAGAGLQVAIWELLVDYDGTFDLNSGNFRVSNWGPIALVASSYLESFGVFALHQDPQSYVTNSYLLFSDPSPQSQHMIVPEPPLALPFAVLVIWLIARRLYVAHHK